MHYKGAWVKVLEGGRLVIPCDPTREGGREGGASRACRRGLKYAAATATLDCACTRQAQRDSSSASINTWAHAVDGRARSKYMWATSNSCISDCLRNTRIWAEIVPRAEGTHIIRKILVFSTWRHVMACFFVVGHDNHTPRPYLGGKQKVRSSVTSHLVPPRSSAPNKTRQAHFHCICVSPGERLLSQRGAVDCRAAVVHLAKRAPTLLCPCHARRKCGLAL